MWLGGEIVVFDAARPKTSVRILCELTGIPTMLQLGKEVQENGGDPEGLHEKLKKLLADANRRCLPIRVGLTADGIKVIGVTSTGVVRVFDAASGNPDLVLSNQNGGGSGLIANQDQ